MVSKVSCIALSTKLIWGKNISLLCLLVISISYAFFGRLQYDGNDVFEDKVLLIRDYGMVLLFSSGVLIVVVGIFG